MPDEKKIREIRERLDAIAPWPSWSDETTALGVARYLAVRAQIAFTQHIMPFTMPGGGGRLDPLICEKINGQFAAAHALQVLARENPERADEVARQITAAWNGGGEVGSWLFGILGRAVAEEVTALAEALTEAQTAVTPGADARAEGNRVLQLERLARDLLSRYEDGGFPAVTQARFDEWQAVLDGTLGDAKFEPAQEPDFITRLRMIADQDIGFNAPALADELKALADRIEAEARGDADSPEPAAGGTAEAGAGEPVPESAMELLEAFYGLGDMADRIAGHMLAGIWQVEFSRLTERYKETVKAFAAQQAAGSACTCEPGESCGTCRPASDTES